MKQFEYHCEVVETFDVAHLNELGKNGWELVTIKGANRADIALYFKRELLPEPQTTKLDEKLDSAILTEMLSFRAQYVLLDLGIVTFRDLLKHKRRQLLCYRNFGRKSLARIDELVEQAGLEEYWYGGKKLNL